MLILNPWTLEPFSPSLLDRNDLLCKKNFLDHETYINVLLAQYAIYWLDNSRLNTPCVGPVSSLARAPTGSSSFAGQECPFSMKLSLDTALLQPQSRMRRSSYLLHCLSLSPRCLPCDMERVVKRKNILSIVRVLSQVQKNEQICRAKSCFHPRWQGVGVFCDMHHLIIPNSYPNQHQTWF